jgi:hypothetical protein
MARRTKTAGPSTSPNKVLVIFLVLFILVAIGEGVWAYSLLKERDNWDKVAKDKTDAAKAANLEQDWVKFKLDEVLAAVGDENFYSKSENVKDWLQRRNYFKPPNGTDPPQLYVYKDDRDAFLKTMTVFEELLGFGPTGYGQVKLKDLHKGPTDELRALLPKYPSERREKQALEAKLLHLESIVAKHRAEAQAQIAKFSDEATKEREKTFNFSKEMIKQNETLSQEKDDLIKSFITERAKYEVEIRGLKAALQKTDRVAKDPGRSLASDDVHALLLDISTGKTLWDAPRGKIVRVDEVARKIYIDKGKRDGLKPGLTFLVFTAGWRGKDTNRAVGPLKAIIEVVRVEDEHMASCKINSCYDMDGREIASNDANLTKVLSEGGSLKDGDLLFNLTWGMHVAIVGIVDLSGSGENNPTVQKVNLNDFMAYLNRQGITVDAYMDPLDGKLIGAFTAKTNLIIRGASTGNVKDDRGKAILATLTMAREMAIDRGMFMISPQNFAFVTGYRRPGSADNQQTLTLVPHPPSGGVMPQEPPPPAGKNMP